MGILGLGGVSSVAALSSSKVRKFIGISSVISQSSPSTPSSTPDASVSDLSEEDRQWQFLYKVAQKLFNSLRGRSQDQKSDVIAWLKDKLSVSLENEEDKWENFKSLCDEQQTKETQDENLGPYVDFCSLKSAELEESDARKYSLTGYSFSGWTSFNKKYPNESPLDKFDEWYSSNDPAAQDLDNYLKRST